VAAAFKLAWLLHADCRVVERPVNRSQCLRGVAGRGAIRLALADQHGGSTRTLKTALTISVAMCTCNGEAYLKQQLDSIRAQSVPPDELIVCDDASTDRTVGILEAFKESCSFPVTIIVNQTRVGVCKNFENAIRHCSGDIIFLADQDDIWLPFKFETIMAAFDSNPDCGYVFSNADLIDEQGNDIGRDLWTSIGFDKKQQGKYAAGDQLSIMLKRFTLVYGMTMAFRAVFRPKLIPFECGFPLATAHDTWISLILSSIGVRGVAIPASLIKYRQHPKQLASAGKPLGFVELVVKARSSTMKLDLQLADALEHFEMRLQELEPESGIALNARRQMNEKATHLRARVRANSSSGLLRFKTVFFESISGRYGRYSRSFKSIVKDLISN
jgi:glycosyltransferase involved in cell wall biosynthesis